MISPSVLGRWISIAGHPFVVVPLAIVVAAPRAATAPVLLIVLAGMVALGVHVYRGWRRGEITDVDVSERRQRPAFYARAILGALAAALVLWLTHQPLLAIRAAILTAAIFVVGVAVNRWVKLSLHTAFAAFAAGIAFGAGLAVAAAFAALALLVAWGRVACRRHTVPDVVVGLVAGAVAAALYVLR